MRTNSGLNFSNISAGFAGASNALSQAASIKAQQQLEEMKDMRAENLARMNWSRDMLKQREMLARQKELQESSQQYGEEMQTRREIAAQTLSQQNQNSVFARYDAAHKAELEDIAAQQKGATDRQTRQLIAENEIGTQREISRIDAAKADLIRQYNAAVKSNVSLSVMSDPDKKAAAAARDPTIAPLLDQLSALDRERVEVATAHVLRANAYGDPNFSGPIKLPAGVGAQPGSDASSAAPPLLPNDGGGKSTPNNPLAPSVPAYPTNSAADNAPAVDRASAAAATTPPSNAPPGSSNAGMPPTVGIQRPPVTSMVGPLRSAPQLIPTSPTGLLPGTGSSLTGTAASMGPIPGINVPAISQQPQLIPQGR
jgi:hypothetical protein